MVVFVGTSSELTKPAKKLINIIHIYRHLATLILTYTYFQKIILIHSIWQIVINKHIVDLKKISDILQLYNRIKMLFVNMELMW